ncbi:hypothetical protein B484DRAFT_457018 [Ochromonadaceae sp. CCMP2298]|nr:hypothetical protein B484DRAFT_457018 [Ochromonadaceae sp. CCMP2298]
MQEFQTAREAVLSVYPGASITERRLDSYPVQVKVYVNEECVFQTDQRNLFKKYGAKRTESIALIQAAVSKK